MWDVFISHAWEDKEEIARPLAEVLKQKGLSVWYDEFTLTLGDSLRRSIDRGLAESEYGVVILSPHFFAKEWPKRELDGLVAKEVSSGKTILPVWHNVTWEEVRRFSPTLADKLAVSTARGLDAVVEEILRALKQAVSEAVAEEVEALPPVAAPPLETPISPVSYPRRKRGWLPTALGIASVVLMAGACIAAGVVVFGLFGEETPTVPAIVLPTASPTTLLLPATSTPSTKVVSSTPTPVHPTPTPAPSAPLGMVYVPAGEFWMGSDEGDSDEQPVHTIYLDAFYIDKYEVTNAQFAQFLNERGNQQEVGVTWLDIGSEYCLITQIGEQYQPKSGHDDHPVIEVSWYGAKAYCEWAGARLPTEAEWEKACRGTDGRTYPWGERIDCDHAQYTECEGLTVPVGSKPKGASPYGALDMAGNVREWIADWYGEDYYSQSPGRNPPGPDSGEGRVLRGNSWMDRWSTARCTIRYSLRPGVRNWSVGFRCARGSL